MFFLFAYRITLHSMYLSYLRTPFLTDLFFHMFRLVFLSRLQFVQCLCILFIFYLTVLFACMIRFYYNVCNCHAFIKGNLLTMYLQWPTLNFEVSYRPAILYMSLLYAFLCLFLCTRLLSFVKHEGSRKSSERW